VAEVKLLDTWPEMGPREVWRHDVGVGRAGVAIADGQVFVNDRLADKTDVLRVFDLNSGDALWSYSYDAPGQMTFDGATSTPCVTDTHVYLTGPMGDVTAINRKTYAPDWSCNLHELYPDEKNRRGYGPSPILADGMLIISPTAKNAPLVVALDPKTGERVWESNPRQQRALFRQEETNLTLHTPQIRTIAGVRGMIIRDSTSIYFIDTKTGKLIWFREVYEDLTGSEFMIPPVTVIPQTRPDDRVASLVFIASSNANGSVIFRHVKDDEPFGLTSDTKQRTLYRIREGGPAFYDDGYLYVCFRKIDWPIEENFEAGLLCMEAATGKVTWKSHAIPTVNAGSVEDDKLYAYAGETGELSLINLNPNKFEVISKFTAIKPEGESNSAWWPIAISDGRLVIRDHGQIVCFDLRVSPNKP